MFTLKIPLICVHITHDKQHYNISIKKKKKKHLYFEELLNIPAPCSKNYIINQKLCAHEPRIHYFMPSFNFKPDILFKDWKLIFTVVSWPQRDSTTEIVNKSARRKRRPNSVFQLRPAVFALKEAASPKEEHSSCYGYHQHKQSDLGRTSKTWPGAASVARFFTLNCSSFHRWPRQIHPQNTSELGYPCPSDVPFIRHCWDVPWRGEVIISPTMLIRRHHSSGSPCSHIWPTGRVRLPRLTGDSVEIQWASFVLFKYFNFNLQSAARSKNTKSLQRGSISSAKINHGSADLLN